MNGPEAFDSFKQKQLVLIESKQFFEVSVPSFNMPANTVVTQDGYEIQATIRTQDTKWGTRTIKLVQISRNYPTNLGLYKSLKTLYTHYKFNIMVNYKNLVKIIKMFQKLSKVLLLTSLIASTASIAFAEPNKINEKTTEIEKLQISKQIMGDVDEYGSFYIDKNGKFVLGIAKEDSKTSDIIRDLKESFSDEEVKIEKGRKYTSQELKSINKLLSIFSEYNTDDSSITSTILTKNWVKLL